MKKGMILFLAVCCAMSVLAPGMTATAYAVEENVVIADQVTDSDETWFVVDSSAAPISIIGEIAEPLFKHGSDIEKYRLQICLRVPLRMIISTLLKMMELVRRFS